VRFSHEGDILSSRAILEGNEEVLSLTGDEGMSLSSGNCCFGTERNQSSDDELESGKKELMVSFGRSRKEAIEVCNDSRDVSTM